MAELIYSVKRVFEDYLKDNQSYNIPEYQRGYKWTDKQINQLLDDINAFETGDDKDLFYCLQNITLVLNNENKLNVVDGQQRLTTISLLLAYLGESDRVKSKLFYTVREPSNDFLQRVIENNDSFLTNIRANNDFHKFLSETEATGKDYDYQDIYFMYQAIHTIEKWFTDNASVCKIVFKEKLLQNVKLIVNRIENIEEQELFMNLNAGKVQLDGSDLVRAILITRVAKQEMDEFDSQEVKDVVRLNERRIRIGWELDEINAWWSKENVSEYFSPFTNLKTGEKETIKFDQIKHPINLLYKIWAESLTSEIGKQKYLDLKLNYFETKNTKALTLYTSIILLHRTLKDWYEDREIYHYLGFLFSQKSISFNSVWKEWTIENAWNDFSEEEKNKKLTELKDQIHQKRPINSIGNLVLLHLSINRGFGNDYYSNKRISVINNTENGEYVRQHTLKVFVKQTNNDDLSNWTMMDIRLNADKIHDTIKAFFNFKSEEGKNE